jgi:hypothetical protein
VLVGLVDVGTDKEYAVAHGLVAFPHVRMLLSRGPSAGEGDGEGEAAPPELVVEDLVGSPSAAAMIELLNARLGLRRAARSRARPMTLTAATFGSVTLNPDASALVSLCRDEAAAVCRAAQEALTAILSAGAGHAALFFAQSFDRALCDQYDVRAGAALALFFPRGFDKVPVLVSELSARNDAAAYQRDVLAYLAEQLGAAPLAAKGDWAVAQLLPELDAEAAAFLDVPQARRAEALRAFAQRAQAAIARVDAAAAARLRAELHALETAMQRVLQHGDAFVAAETARLGRIMQSGSVGDAALAGMRLRQAALNRIAAGKTASSG